MTNINELSFDKLVPTNSKYLTKNDVEDGIILTIKGFQYEDIEGDNGAEQKLIMYFQEDYPPMVVNRTNAQLLAIVTGAKASGEVIGKEIVVYNDPSISFGGKVTGGIRIKKVQAAPKRAAPASINVPLAGSDIDDDIPF